MKAAFCGNALEPRALDPIPDESEGYVCSAAQFRCCVEDGRKALQQAEIAGEGHDELTIGFKRAPSFFPEVLRVVVRNHLAGVPVRQH